MIAENSHQPTRPVAKQALKALVYVYRAFSVNSRPACRFIPSCSEYAVEALDRFGARKAVPLVVRRLGKCRPGGPFGFDPVPALSPATHERARQ